MSIVSLPASPVAFLKLLSPRIFCDFFSNPVHLILKSQLHRPFVPHLPRSSPPHCPRIPTLIAKTRHKIPQTLCEFFHLLLEISRELPQNFGRCFCRCQRLQILATNLSDICAAFCHHIYSQKASKLISYSLGSVWSPFWPFPPSKLIQPHGWTWICNYSRNPHILRL